MDMKPIEGFLNISKIIERLPDLKHLGLRAIHLKGLHRESNDFKRAYESTFGQSATDLEKSLELLINNIHKENLSLIVQIPVGGKQSDSLPLDQEYQVSKNIEFWAKLGADGIFLDGLEQFGSDVYISRTVSQWSTIFEKAATSPNKKILMTSYLFAQNLKSSKNAEAGEALSHIKLLDASLDATQNYEELHNLLTTIAAWDNVKGRPWINWNLVQPLPLSRAALAFQFFLPGTISVPDLKDVETLRNLTSIRTLAVPIYMNGNLKRCDCPEGHEKEKNFALTQPMHQLIQMERFYNRRNRYLLVASLSNESQVQTPLSHIPNMYSNGQLLLDTSKRNADRLGKDVAIRELILEPENAIVILLPK